MLLPAVRALLLLAASRPGPLAVPEPEVLAPLARLTGVLCDPPYRGSSCPPTRRPPRCDARRTARSRDGTVTAEVVQDGAEDDLLAMHLVIHAAGDRWVLREIGHEGVACGPLEPVGASFIVVEMRVADLLFGPRPEVVLRTRSGTSWWRGGVDDLLVCTTDTTPPSCAAWPVEPAGLRFSRPNRVRAGKYVHHVAAAEPRG